MGNLATAEACPANPGRPQTISAFNKTFLQRSWYWTGEIKGAENQWAEFTFTMDEKDPHRATMVVEEGYWDPSMQVDEDKEMADQASSSLSIADGM